MKEELLTIVIAVYNSEKFLNIALESVINSSYKNLEIICIDDASTDKSLDILEYYKNLDKRIIIISKNRNEGPVKAREEAYKIFKGEYITNIDSDDFIEKDAFEKAIKIFKDNKDIDVSLYDSYYLKNNLEEKINKFPNGRILSGKEAFIYSLNWEIGGLGVFKREIFKKNMNISDLYNGDEVIIRKIFLNSEKIYLSEGKYFYRINDNSLTKNKSFNKRRIEMVISGNYILKLAKEKKVTGEKIDDYEIKNIKLFINQAKKIIKNKKKISKADVIKIKNIVDEFKINIDYKFIFKYFIKKFKLIKLIKLVIKLKFYIMKIKKI